MSAGSEMLRRMADQHYALSLQYEAKGERATADGFRKTWKLMRDEAIKLEQAQLDEVGDVFKGFREESK